MGFIQWLSSHTIDIIQSVGIIGSLAFTAYSYRLETRARRINNLLRVTGNHRDIWSELYDRPELGRVLAADIDLEANPIRPEEELFVRLLILHLGSTFRAAQNGEYQQPDGLPQDMITFFSLPLPRVVWHQLRAYQDEDFVRFVEDVLRSS